MSEYLFSYGTLQPGLAPDEVAPLVAQLVPIGKGFLPGVLYDFGHYPGAILDPHSDRKIFGTVLRLPGNPEVLQALDSYEEFDPAAPAGSQFIRIAHPVTMDSGGALRCWLYVYNRDPGDAPILKRGLFP